MALDSLFPFVSVCTNVVMPKETGRQNGTWEESDSTVRLI
ncbi:hypothetical protein LMG23994_04942 [Cupriavidus pinatubonensis]|uniref:Uncharacterized protein n=1 Tax=Cupriavidus pinatubonensis TaxID=248026 RepID=A0ABM8XQN2_9BURK|nr:hypothetical protein LMG23994_04942 [Cupriavidus pinatubonensis]